jgi:outer membrane receptor protein involved in Fe transport
LLAQTAPPAAAPQNPSEPEVEPVRTSITVSEKITAETPANVDSISVKELKLTPGVNIDDRLREVPGFSLFRRTSSVTANPTTQGVSLRGIGSTGASRTLVLWDGVPMNDPFGGWLYWTRFPVDELQRVEVSRGASTAVFGDLAMGGAIGLFSREASHLHLNAGYSFGNSNTHDLNVGFSDLWQHFAVSGTARGFTTDGFWVVPATIRGAVDRKAGVKFATGDVRFDFFGAKDRFFAALDILAEERPNGTYLTYNSTGLGTASIHYIHEFSRDEISFLGFRTQDQYHSTFSAVSADRNTETLNTRQTVPSNGNGADLLWSHHGGPWNIVAGTDVNQTRGFSTDHLIPTGLRYGGGTLLQHGEFIQTDFKLSGIQFFLGARHQVTGRSGQFFSPSAGLAYGKGHWRGRGSVYRAYRSPTLNELYRQFRTGNTVTLANGNLAPETLFGAEIGLDYLMERGAFRVTGFRNSLGDLITNVTLSSTPTLITRQRQNGIPALSRGVEMSLNHRWGALTAEAAYLFADSRSENGLRLAQVAKNQGSAGVAWHHRDSTTVSFSLRTYSSQFDDDQNKFLLPGYLTLQVVAQQHLVRSLFASFEMENAADRLYYTGFTPNPTIGTPRLVRVGLRWNGKL